MTDQTDGVGCLTEQIIPRYRIQYFCLGSSLGQTGEQGHLSSANETVTAVGAQVKTCDVVFKAVESSSSRYGPMAVHFPEIEIGPCLL